jgi:two-component system, cell cycle sensor histidine kinase and response regulator CckA
MAEHEVRAMNPQELLERLPLVTYVLGPERGPEYLSPQVEAMLGFRPEQIVGDPDFWRSRVEEADLERFRAAFDELRARGEFTCDYRVHHADGHIVWVRDTGSFVERRVHGYLVDITREKELEGELARERVTLDAFFRESSIGLAITDSAGRYVRINDALAELNGCPADATIGKTLAEIAPEIAAAVDPLRERADGVDRFFVELPSRGRHTMLSYFPFTVDGERHHGRIVVDVTEQRRAEVAEQRLRHLLEQLPLVAYVNDVGGMRRARYVTPQMEKLTGYSAEEFVADPELGDRLIHPDDLAEIVAREARARATGEPFEHEYRIVRADGEVRWVLDRMETLYDDDGVVHEQGFLVDVTAMHETTSLLRAVWDSALDAMLVADDEGRYVDANPAACALFGRSREELLSSTVRDVVETTDLQWRAFRERGYGAGESTIVRPDGERRRIEETRLADVLPGRHLTVLRDATERRQLQQELWRAQKLESVGRLAGGVAQDFNNLLTAIRGHAQLLQSRTAPESVEHDHAQEIDRVAGRAASLTAQLLALGRRQMLQASAVDLNRKVELMRDELVEAVAHGIDLVFELDPALCAVHVDRGVVLQAIRNLVVNAAEAMPDGGSVVVSTTVENVEGRNDLPDGRYAVLRVADGGPGIEPAFFDHLFEPFFTTKAPGERAGLGLASAYGAIRQSGGTITVESTLGEGSTFSIYLPEASVASEGAARGGGETLVVVERDPAVRDVLRELLTDAGYRVVPAWTPNDAQTLAGRNDLAIDLVVADLDDDASAQLAAELEASRPGLRLVQVAKPFTAGRLYDVVRTGLAPPER